MISCRTFHATVCEPSNFEGGYWPLTHFGAPELGVWQTLRHMMDDFSAAKTLDDLPKHIYLYEVDIEFRNPLVTPDLLSPGPVALLRHLKRAGILTHDACEGYVGEVQSLTKKGTGHTLAGRKFVCGVIESLGYDAIQYENELEKEAYAHLAKYSLGRSPCDNSLTCYSNIRPDQVKLAAAPKKLNVRDFYDVMPIVFGGLHSSVPWKIEFLDAVRR